MGIFSRAVRNISRRKIRALLVIVALGFSMAIMVTHDSAAAHHTERMLLLKDGKILKEKPGSHAQKKAPQTDAEPKEETAS